MSEDAFDDQLTVVQVLLFDLFGCGASVWPSVGTDFGLGEGKMRRLTSATWRPPRYTQIVLDPSAKNDICIICITLKVVIQIFQILYHPKSRDTIFQNFVSPKKFSKVLRKFVSVSLAKNFLIQILLFLFFSTF